VNHLRYAGRRLLQTLPVFFGMASEGFDRLWTPHMLRNFEFPSYGGLEPVVWFGVLRGVGMLVRSRPAVTGRR
jgi:DHA3 family tetracycline resistance protein-like MFS transporter